MNDEQLEEYSALELIFPDLITKQTETSFDVIIEPNPGEENSIGIKLSIFLNPDYPREAPSYTLKPLYDLDRNAIEPLNQVVSDIIDRDMGNPMMFDLIEGIREWLNNQYSAEEEEKIVEVVKKVYDTYTPVTPESFLAWQEQYNRELKIKEENDRELLKAQPYINGLTYQDVWSKPSGKEIFEKGYHAEADEEDKEGLDAED
ncbi:unnamed protein product [Blepharisma stoltei]|uniref:RWD domain-containing protein n=1 Tax=Blepharisma stoltei TaxID=1481888 RepID=A0AAU9JBW3_9CILI|nr:unnamed protein product [Blepharisma stoltei]